MSEQNCEFNILDGRLKDYANPAGSTFFDIAGISHNENAWSDIYAYFFDTNNPHKLGRTFIDCLINLIKEKRKTNSGFDFPEPICNVNVYREVATKDGRIDLLIFADDTAIIIENKVYHNLSGNDLSDYMNLVHSYGVKRVGIILTLKPIHVSDCRYVNITHLELMESVCKNIADKPCDDFCKLIIVQFTKVVKGMSGLSQCNQMRFINNKEEILENAHLLDEVKEWYCHTFNDKEFIDILNKEVNVMPSRELLRVDRPAKKYRYVQFKISDIISLDILFEPLWNPNYEIHYFPARHQSLFLTLEIGNFLNLRNKYHNLVNEIKDIVEPTGLYVEPESRNWWHFVRKEIPVTDSELFENTILTGKILGELRKGMSDFSKILNNKNLYKIGTNNAD